MCFYLLLITPAIYSFSSPGLTMELKLFYEESYHTLADGEIYFNAKIRDVSQVQVISTLQIQQYFVL